MRSWWGDRTQPNCNFIYSLLGIETKFSNFETRTSWSLQFHLLPIRDWNELIRGDFIGDTLLQFHLLPIRDWNLDRPWHPQGINDCNFIYSLLGIETANSFASISRSILQFHLLPIRDWNVLLGGAKGGGKSLQFHLLPIRDWNGWVWCKGRYWVKG